MLFLSLMFLFTHSIKIILVLPRVQLQCDIFHEKFVITLGVINGSFFLHFHSNDIILLFIIYFYVLHYTKLFLCLSPPT